MHARAEIHIGGRLERKPPYLSLCILFGFFEQNEILCIYIFASCSGNPDKFNRFIYLRVVSVVVLPKGTVERVKSGELIWKKKKQKISWQACL
jgi:hypothetical protein